MLHSPFFILLLSILLTLALLHLLGLYYVWYWLYWWFDIIAHFLGGFWIGGMALFITMRCVRASSMPVAARKLFTIAFLGVLFSASAWEVFEYYGGAILVGEREYVVDTIIDLFVGTAGAMSATVYFIFKKYHTYV